MSLSSSLYSIFVGHLNPDVKKHELRDLFEKCGPVVDIFICQNDRPGGYSYGFVRYSELAYAERAIRELHRWEVHGSAITVRLAKDSLEKVRREKATEEKMVNSQPRPRNKTSSFNIVEDTMYLARVKESCTTLGIQHNNVEKNVSQLMDYVQKSETKKNPTQWGPLMDPVSSFDHVTKKLMSRSQESGENGCSLGSKKAQEFITSLKTVMQEIEDFLSKTARNAGSIATDLFESGSVEEILSKLDETGERKIDYIKEKHVAQCGEEKLIIEENSKKLEQESNNTEMRLTEYQEGSEYKRLGNKSFLHDEFSACDQQIVGQDHCIRQNFSSDTDIVVTEKLVRSQELNMESSENCEIKSVRYTNSGEQDRSITSKRGKSFDSALSSLTLSRSPIICVDSEKTGGEFPAKVANTVSENTNKKVATFFLTESPELGLANTSKSSERLQLDNQDKLGENCSANHDTIKRQVRSLDSYLCEADPTALHSALYSCEEDDLSLEKNCSTSLKTVKRQMESEETDIVLGTRQIRAVDQKREESLALEALFAKLPPVSSFERSNSQDSSLSEDSYEGIDDSGVESDFRPNLKNFSQSSLQEHSEHLKSILGIKSNAGEIGGNSGSDVHGANLHYPNIVFNQGFKNFKKPVNNALSKQEDSVRYVGRRAQLSILSRASYGRGWIFQQ